MRHFTITELDTDPDVTMIGTLLNVSDEDIESGAVIERLKSALQTHYDCIPEMLAMQDPLTEGLFQDWSPVDFIIHIDDVPYNIQVVQTYLF